MASNYPPPPGATSLPESRSASGSAPAQEHTIERASQSSPQVGQGPTPQSYGQSPQEFAASPQQPAPQAQQYDNNGHNDHNASVDNINAAAAAAAAVATAHHGLAALQAATVPQQIQSAPTQYALPRLATPINAGLQYQMPPGAGGAAPQPKHQAAPKATRLRRACDMCSARKVKCDEAGPPCKPCKDLNVECTYNREMKRRGPPNKHAEAARNKRQRLDTGFPPALQPQRQLQPQLQPQLQAQLQPAMSPNPQNAAEALVSIAGHGPSSALDGEAIAPWPVLSLLVDDFFTYIHPLAPFPHEPTFRQQFHDRLDRTDPEFLALLASMIGCLVASFPRTARLHLKNQHSSNLFPRAITMIERCRAVALDARGAQFMDKEDATIYDAATSYFLALAAGYTMQSKLCRRFMAETLAFIRELGFHKPRNLGSSVLGVTYRGPAFDHIHDQLGKRIFWVLFLGIRSMVQLGTPHTEIILPAFGVSEFRPEFPVEVDDQYILQHQILGQPEGTVSLLTGFVRALRVYESMDPLISIEIAYGVPALSWFEQRALMETCVNDAKAALDDMPPELYLDMDSPPAGLVGSTEAFEDAPGYHYHPPAYPAPQPPTDVRHIVAADPMRRRQLQFEIQKANIYVSQLATRSYYVERYLNLRDVQRLRNNSNGFNMNGGGYGDGKAVAAAAVHAASQAADEAEVDKAMTEERERIVKNLLVVITSLPQQHMEPNGASLINKIRQVASTLLNDSPDRKGPLAKRNEEYLARFLGILTRLEKTVPANAGPGVALGAGMGEYHAAMTPQDEEDELRNWADLREHQLRFASQDGFMGDM